MQTLLISTAGKQDVGMNASQIRRLIRAVFSDADVRHLCSPGEGEQLTVDGLFVLMRSAEATSWYLGALSGREDGNAIVRRFGEFSLARDAVRRLVVLMATARVEFAIGPEVEGRASL